MRVLNVSAAIAALSVIAIAPAAGQSVNTGIRGGATVTAKPAPADKPRPTVHADTSASAHVAANPVLGMRLRPLLPTGMTLEAAAQGFRTQGQFIAALHASKNLDIPFADLKADMTGEAHESLGASIKKRKAAVDADVEARKAEGEAAADLKATTNPTLAQRVAADTTLSARLQPLLPAGMTMEAAAQGFRNEGQFCAAVHVAHNLDIPLADLKAQLMGAARDSLGQAIRTLKPTADARNEALKAEAEAKTDLDASAAARKS